MHEIFQDKTFDLLPAKLIIALEGGLNTSSETINDFNEKQLSTAIAKLLLDIGTPVKVTRRELTSRFV